MLNASYQHSKVDQPLKKHVYHTQSEMYVIILENSTFHLPILCATKMLFYRAKQSIFWIIGGLFSKMLIHIAAGAVKMYHHMLGARYNISQLCILKK